MSFGHNIKYLREQRGLSQAQLAEEIGVWQTMISALERNDRGPSLKTATRFASFFGVTIDALNSSDISVLEQTHETVAAL